MIVSAGKWEADNRLKRFKIEHDPQAGFYLYVFDGEKCVADYLQDTLELAMLQAEQDFGVPPSSWRKI